MAGEWPTRLDLETMLPDALSTPLSSHPVTVGSFGDVLQRQMQFLLAVAGQPLWGG